jgi:V/A-type H+-transporting ATPase subunit C
MDIDFYNLLSVIRGKFWGLEEDQVNDLIVSATPSASKELLGRMISAATIRDAFNELSGTRYKSLIPEAENELIYQSSLRSFTKMFSFATIIGITKLTAYEVRNLAAIAYAVEQKIPTEVTMSKLILEED